MRYITKIILVLSLVSLLTDISSEMLYPIMPIYLQEIGFSVLLIGVLEGMAEAMAGLSKGYFGSLSDQKGKRVPFVQLGYTLSSFSKPMLAAFKFPLWVFFSRAVDRLGKGLRTGARDAILGEESTPEHRAKVFGFHRSMDTLGAAIGPVFAWLYLYYNPGQYRLLFLIAFIPALAGAVLTLVLKEKKKEPLSGKTNYSFFNFLGYWKQSPSQYKVLLAGLLFFTLLNSSDVFLLLAIKNRGFTDNDVIAVYIFYNIVYAVFSFPIGVLADKIGVKKIYIAGLLLFSAVYLGMAWNKDLYGFYLLFFLYGLYAGATEGISKAWISSVTEKQNMGTAMGLFHALNSLVTIAASSMAGLLWHEISPSATFIVSGAGAVIVAGYFVTVKKQ